MTTLQDLESLYNQGNYSQCLESLIPFLLVNNDSIEAVLLKAKCEYQTANQISYQDPADFSLYTTAYHSFEYILKLKPDHEEAMLYATYINLYITEENLPEAIIYCDILALSENEGTRVTAITYRIHANFTLGNMELTLQDITLLITHYKSLYPDKRSILDKELGQLYLQKTKIYLWHQTDAAKVFEVVKESKNYPHNDDQTHTAVASLALAYQQLEIAGEAAFMAFSYSEQEPAPELIELYHSLNNLGKNGHLSKLMVFALLMALRKFGEYLQADVMDSLSLSLDYIKVYPDYHIPYHFAGTFLFEEKKYAEALPYLEKSIQLGGMALGLRRYIDTKYRLTGQLPNIENWPEDSPGDYYSAGCDFYYQTAPEIWTEEIAAELQQLQVKFYANAYDSFYDYYYNNTGKTLINEVHTFAMCCNNYGIALTATADFEKAVEVHAIGYSLSPFWEQLKNWGKALKALEKYEDAIEILLVAISDDGSYLSFINYLTIKAEILEMTFELGRVEEATGLLKAITEEYDDFIEENKAELTAEELFELSEQYIIVQNVRHNLLSQLTPEEEFKAWQNELVKNPDDNSAWYMLMQKYYSINDYQQCIACADNYQAVKKEAIQESSRCKIYYMRGLSHKNLGNYEQAIADLTALIEPLKIVYQNDEYELSRAYLHLADCYFTLKKWDNCNEAAYQAIVCYIRNEWAWDDELLKVKLQYADALYTIGLKEDALENINNILEAYPANEDALSRKKEWKKGLFSFFR